jgi:hypothetical protein
VIAVTPGKKKSFVAEIRHFSTLFFLYPSLKNRSRTKGGKFNVKGVPPDRMGYRRR